MPNVGLDAYDSHLDLRINPDGLGATCLHTDGFQYMWKGSRATHGVRGGAYMFEVRVVEALPVSMPDTAKATQNICRVGASMPLSSLFLGDTTESWGWGGTGKKSHNNTYADYGGRYSVGDVVGVIVDIDNLQISFTKNGQFMGVAFNNITDAVLTTGLFPHILVKNMKVEVNFSRQRAWYQPPGHVRFFDEATGTHMMDNLVDRPASVKEAEFVMMVGLPACGKTYWALKHMEENPKKNYYLLGTNAVIDQMKVVGLTRKGNYAQRWQELISQATPCFNKLCDIAGTSARNIILDQTNVFPRARQRKVAQYHNFGTRRAIVVLNDENTLSQRTDKREREEGKFVPEEAVMGMKEAFTKPQLSEGFTHIEYVEMPERDAAGMLRRYNDEGRDYKRRNPGKGKGNKPQAPLHKRDSSDFTFDKNDFQNRLRQETGERGRSRSPRRGGGGVTMTMPMDKGGKGQPQVYNNGFKGAPGFNSGSFKGGPPGCQPGYGFAGQGQEMGHGKGKNRGY